MSKFSARAFFLAVLMGANASVFAHGGVSMDDDTCIMQIGPYSAHFTGYQPKVRASQEFCEDIPVVADAIIVLDFISRPLREMSVDFRIIRDIHQVGISATAADIEAIDNLEQATLVHRPPEHYPRGSVSVEIPFTAAGQFIGVLTANDAKTQREYISVFPFSVGLKRWYDGWYWFVLAVVFSAGLLMVSRWRGEAKRAT